MVNPLKLHKELLRADIPVHGVSADGRIDFDPEATPEQRDLAEDIKAAHDPTDTDALHTEETRDLWRQYTALKGKAPAEIFALMQGRMDAWTSLADARADLREWLPLMAAAIAWMLMRDVHTE